MSQKMYEIDHNAPTPISWDDYAKVSYREYIQLLDSAGDDESAFQSFFERNPSYIPGAFELFGPSGHYPFSQSLISQPEIQGASFKRIPDFVWLAQDSLNFTPVFIEIEKPSKLTFTKAGVQTAEFSQAIDQILEWKALLNKPTTILNFYEGFNIPDRIRDKNFEPQFALIYGRHSEYENQVDLLNKRAQLAQYPIKLISYDRLCPDPKLESLLCTRVSQRRYNVKTIPPTYRYSPITAENLSLVNGFQVAISKMERTSQERKKFLSDRYPYWYEFGCKENKGILCPSDCE